MGSHFVASPFAGKTPSFTFPSTLSDFDVTPSAYIARHAGEFDFLVAGAVVAHKSRILLIQRSRHDYAPLFWEVPGGMTEATDLSVLSAACRELAEESGLVARGVIEVVEDRHQWTDGGCTWRKVTFMVDVEGGESRKGEPVVTLDPNEHEDFAWVSEDEFLAGRAAGGRELRFVSEEQRKTIFDAYMILRRKRKEMEGM